jgi:hypothetical protein
MPSQFSSGLGQGVAPEENSDWGFTKAVAQNPKGFAESLPSDLFAAAAAPGKLAYEGAADVLSKVTGDSEYGGNLAEEEQGGDNLPVNRFLSKVAQTNPNLATVGQLSKAVPEFASMMVVNPAGTVGRLVAAGFSADMIAGVKPLATALGSELGKPAEQQDPDKIAQLKAALIQTGIFAPLAGTHAVNGAIDSVRSGYDSASQWVPVAEPNLPDARVSNTTIPETPAAPEAAPVAAKVDDLAAQVADLQATLKGKLPEQTQETVPTQEAPAPAVDTSRVEVRTPDGQLDQVQTAIARMRLEAEQPSEPTPEENPAPVENSQPDAGTTVSPAPVASLTDSLKAIFDPATGNMTRGGDYIKSLARKANADELADALRWTQSEAANPKGEFVRRFVGANLADVMTSKGLDPDPIAQDEYLKRNGVTPPGETVQTENGTKAAIPATKPESMPLSEKPNSPSQSDLDEQGALETVQEAVGLNKAQSRRLAELQAKNQPLTEPPASATKTVAAPGTDTVRTAAESSNASQRGQFPAQPEKVGAVGVTAEGGSNPPLGAAAISSRKVSRADAQRPPDLIDHIEGQVGTIDPKLIKEANPDWKPTGAARKIFKAGGTPADSDLNALGTAHGVTRDTPLDEFGDRINAAAAARKGWREQFYKQERQVNEEARQTSTFQKDISQVTKKTETLVPDDLNEGDTFALKGAKFKVSKLDYDADGRVTHLTLDDGKKYGTQEVDGQTALRMDKGSLEKGGVQHAAGDFAFDQAESVHDQKARQLAEKRKVDEANAKAGMLVQAQARLTGEDVDTNQEMFGAEVKRDKAGQGSLFAGGQQRGLAVQPVTTAIKSFLGTDELPSGIRVVRDETATWGAKIEGRNSIVVNAAQIGSEARARQVIIEEGLHGVWKDSAVQGAWKTVRDLVTPAEMRAEFLKRKAQGLPHDPETIREEAAIARLIKADANKGVFARLYEVVRNVIKRTFGIDLPAGAHSELKSAAMEFLRNREGWQGARGEFATHDSDSEGLHQQESQIMPGQGRLFSKGEPAKPKLMDIRRRPEEILTGAAEEVASWPEQVKAADGSDILLKNPEGGTMASRVKHLIWDDERNQLHRGKAGWLPSVPDTLRNADLRLRDPETGNRVYVRDYDDGTRHMVVVRPDGTVEDQKPFTGKLITQFPGHERSRQTDFPVEWSKARSQSQGTSAAAPTGSSRLDARPSVSDSTLPPEAGGVKPDAKDVIVEHVGHMGDIRIRTADGLTVDFRHNEQDAFDRAEEMAAESGGKVVDNTQYAAGDQPRPIADVQRDFAAAEDDLRAKTSDLTKPEAGTQAERQQAASLAGARYRALRDELSTHPDFVAEQILKQHKAITEANQILKPMGKAVTPDDFPNPGEVAAKLGEPAAKRVNELGDQVAAAQSELMRTNRLAPKMVDRITGEMMNDGRLPKMQAITDLGAGRTLDRMTQFLKANDFESPKATFAERLALGKKFADTVAGAKDAATRAMLKSQAAWKAMVESFKRPPLDDDYRTAKKSWISYDQRTAHENYQYAKALTDKVPLKVRRMAMSVWLDADGDTSLLKFQRDSVPERYREAWNAALKLTADEKRIALDVKANFAAKLDDAIRTGLVEKGREDYGVPQRWKEAPQIDAGDISGEKRGKPGNPYAKLDPRDPFFSFQRQTPSYFDGIMAKGVPENLDVAHLVTVYDAGFHKALGSRGWIAALQDATAEDGLPVVKISGKASAAANGEGKAYFVDSKAHAPGDITVDGRPYRAIDHFALRDWKVAFKDEAGNPIIVKGDMLVHPDYFDDVKNELETPKWTQQGLGRAALAVSSFLKSSKFVGPFHIVTEALHASFHGVVPSVRGFDIDLQDPKQALIARNMTLGFGKAREMFEDGLASHGGIWAHVPGLGDAVVRMNNFTFNEYIPRLKMKVGLAVLDRNTARYSKELTPEQIGELTGRQMDGAFGGQNWRLMGANKSTLAVMRLGFVAPDFLISRAKVIGQAFKPYNKEQRVFLLAQAVGVYALCRTLNATFSDDHDPHFEPHNWDSVVLGKRAYHARFIVSDAANLARDMMGLGGFNQHGIPFITGRLGVVPKTGIEALTGKDLFTGQNKDGLFDTDNPALKAFSIVAKDTSEWMTPMGVDGFMPGAASRGQTGLGSAIVATVGVSSKKESPANDVWNMSRQFNLSSTDPKAVSYQKQRDNDTGTPSDYRALNNLLDAGQLDKAKAEVQALQNHGKTVSQILQHYERKTYFTGSAERETAFYASLTPGQQKTYQAAKAEQQARAVALSKALEK